MNRKTTAKAAAFYAELGANIRRARTARGLTQRQLGAAVSMWPSAINRLELGLRKTQLPEFVQIAAVLKVPPEALLP
jgi:transcriptional regulator with XRE-family HTH domain